MTTINTKRIKHTIKRLARKAILRTIALLENKKFQRKVLNITVGLIMLSASKSLIETVGATEDCSALLLAIPAGTVMLFKNLI